MITQEQRDEVLENLDAQRLAVYTHPNNGETMRSVFDKHRSLDSNYLLYINTIGDTILGFYKTTELPKLLQKKVGVSADDAMRIVSDLQDFLAPVIAREKGEINPNQAELKELQKTFTPAPTTTPTQETPMQITQRGVQENVSVVTSAPTTPSEQTDIEKVKPMRTMEEDMDRVHGYGAYRAQFPDEAQEIEHVEEVIRSASQEDILKEKPALATAPEYEEKE